MGSGSAHFGNHCLKQKELLEREKLILRQRREEQKRELRQNNEEQQRRYEEQQRALEKSRKEEIRKLQIQSQREEWVIMNRKQVLQKELDIKCAAIESDIIDKISERSFSVSGRSKHKTLQNLSRNQVQVNWKLPAQANLKLFLSRI